MVLFTLLVKKTLDSSQVAHAAGVLLLPSRPRG